MSLGLHLSRVRSSEVLGVRATGTNALHRNLRWDKSQPLKEWQLLRAACPKDPSDARIVTHHGVHKRSTYALTAMRRIDNDHREITVGMVVAHGTSEANNTRFLHRNERSL